MGPLLTDYELVVGVCGGIAAYKSAALVSRLVQDGAGVTVAMTAAARRFVGPPTFQALTGRPVLRSLWDESGGSNMLHLDPTEKADLLVVAPATANIIGKLANGVADDLVSTLLLGSACPVLLAPAMNTHMWEHPSTQRNVAYLREIGVTMVGPETGWLACGLYGAGRMSEPEAILEAVRAKLHAAPPKVKPGGMRGATGDQSRDA